MEYLMEKEKRSEIVKSRITPTLRAEIEKDLREQGELVTMSDWLFEAAAERIALRSIRISKHRSVRRAASG